MAAVSSSVGVLVLAVYLVCGCGEDRCFLCVSRVSYVSLSLGVTFRQVEERLGNGTVPFFDDQQYGLYLLFCDVLTCERPKYIVFRNQGQYMYM